MAGKTKTNGDWLRDSEAVSAFYKLATALGISDPERCLGVEQLNEFRGSFSDAVGLAVADSQSTEMLDQFDSSAGMFPEALAAASSDFRTPSGVHWQVTLKPMGSPATVVAIMKGLVQAMEIFEMAVIKGRDWQPVEGSLAPAGVDAGQEQGTSSGPGQQTDGQYIKRGAGRLDKLVFDGSKFDYHVSGRQYAIGDARGWETATSYWDDSCFSGDFSRDLLKGKGVLDTSDFGQELMVEYGKNTESGYWDALSVYPATER